MTVTRTLDYRPRLDERNRAFRVSAADPALLQRPRYWTPGVVLDQGSEGACVGFGVTGEYLASPVRGTFNGYTLGMPASHRVEVAELEASDVYARAKEIDEFEGVDYDGTSVRAGMLVARERGWCSGFSWAFSMLELRAALEEGPVVIGVEWRAFMFDAPGGILQADGEAEGGHCVLVTGYTPRHRWFKGPAYRIRNSWSADWGVNGSAYIRSEGLNSILFHSGGEAAVVSGRHL